jgi:hypothetical protein
MSCCSDTHIEEKSQPLNLKPTNKAMLSSYDKEALSTSDHLSSLNLERLDTDFFKLNTAQDNAILTNGLYEFTRDDLHPTHNLKNKYAKKVEGRAKYLGQESQGKFNGRIHFQDEAGNFFVGVMKDDVLEGFGAVYYANGDFFLGTFVDNRKVTGVQKSVQGTKYEGGFRDEKYHGVGTFTVKDGRTYTGDYVEGKKEGNGTFVWPDGSRYEGEFKNNLQEGKGVFVDKSGKVTKGVFLKGEHMAMQE